MPRKPSTDPSVRWPVLVPGTLAAEVELRLLHPVRGKARYGARNSLILQLLRDWLKEQKANEQHGTNDPNPAA